MAKADIPAPSCDYNQVGYVSRGVATSSMLPRKRNDLLVLKIIDSSSDSQSLTHATQTHMEGDQDTLYPDTGTYMHGIRPVDPLSSSILHSCSAHRVTRLSIHTLIDSDAMARHGCGTNEAKRG